MHDHISTIVDTAPISQCEGSASGRKLRPTSPLTAPLTSVELKILTLLDCGLTNREIAQQLDISEAAVKASLRQLFEKLSVHTRAQLVKVALEQYNGHL